MSQLRHSHSFTVEVQVGGPTRWEYVVHSFNHIHECQAEDGHKHNIAHRTDAARFPRAAMTGMAERRG